MKERPILFTPENAQKCHVGTKTQTRRIVKLSSPHWDYPQITKPGIATFLDSTQANPYNDALDVPCPYGVPGDRLWVREAWAFPGEEALMYKGRPGDAECYKKWMEGENYPKITWTPSIHMPRWACRTVLEITEIRVQRVQEISEEDAKAEGVQRSDRHPLSYRVAFAELWHSINGPGSWDANPWVWAITFKKVG